MNDAQIKMQAFKAAIKKATAIEKQILANMNDRQIYAWEKQIGTHLCDVVDNIGRIERAIKKEEAKKRDETFGGLISFD